MKKKAARPRPAKRRDADAALFAVTGADLEARRDQRLRTLCQRSVMEDPRTVVPIYPPQLRLTNLVLDGMCAGLTESGLKGELLELGAALEIALTVDDALTGWLEGKPTFASARLNESDYLKRRGRDSNPR